MKSLSVIIPTYKPTYEFHACLKSIADQTFQDFEILIILNGCNEPYKSRIQKWIADLKLQSKTNLIQIDKSGVSNARNVGIEKSDAYFITFIDDDDYITSSYFDELIGNYKGGKSIVASNLSLFPKNNNSVEKFGAIEAYENLRNHGYRSIFDSRKLLNGPWMKLFPKEIIKDVRFDTNVSLGEDALFCFTISKNIEEISTTSPEACYMYRRTDSRAWENRSNKDLFYHLYHLLFKYSSVYFSNPLSYNILFFLNRIFAITKTFGSSIITNIKRR